MKLSQPFVVTPITESDKLNIVDYIIKNKEFINDKYREFGGLLFRGFEIQNAHDFEKCALALEPDLKNNYLGTSPRNKVTDYTFTSSELPPHYPIMQHCEMSFLPNPPRKIMFFCQTPAHQGGETPICDFSQIPKNLNHSIINEFQKKGILNIRNYSGFSSSKKPLRQLKSWNEIFETNQKTEVEKICLQNGLSYQWGKADQLQISNVQPALRLHNELNQWVWFNHCQVFHRDAAFFEYKKIFSLRPGLRTFRILILLWSLRIYEKYFNNENQLPMNCKYGDGTNIPAKNVRELIKEIWNTMYIHTWETGDVLLLDNLRMSHGRLPYSGNRKILVSWSS